MFLIAHFLFLKISIFLTGTASVALAGLLAAEKVIGKPISEHKVLFLGAGEVCFWKCLNLKSELTFRIRRSRMLTFYKRT